MAGIPLKSGADFYNLEASRMRLHNLGADPTEVGAGLIYFNTSTGMNTSQKARIYTGNAWKTIAFSEDLDVASNADFLALKDRVDLLSGDIDTDAIISNMREVSAFLAGFAEDASLMDYLNTELGKKLNLTGGEISGDLRIYGYLTTDKTRIRLGTYNIFVSSDVWKVSDSNWQHEYALLHSGNYSEYALPLSGGTINGHLQIGDESNTAYRRFRIWRDGKSVELTTAEGVGILSYNGVGFRFNETSALWNDNTLLHSGNVGEYALKTDGSNEMSGAIKFTGKTLAADASAKDSGIRMYSFSELEAAPSNSIYHSTFSAISSYVGFQLSVYGGADTNDLYYRKIDGNGNWSDWKTIAFTDSDITGNAATATVAESARTLLSAENFKLFYTYPNINTWSLGYYSHHGNLDFETLSFRYGSGYNTAMLINSSGNVTIGAEDKAETSAKLYVDGAISVLGDGATNGGLAVNWGTESQYHLGSNASNDFYISSSNNATFRIVVGGADRMLINSFGNVTIGYADQASQIDSCKFYVNGKTHIYGEGEDVTLGNAPKWGMTLGLHQRGLAMWLGNNAASNIQSHRFDGTATAYNLNLQPLGGNVLIGTTTDNGAKLQVAGNLNLTEVNPFFGEGAELKFSIIDRGHVGMIKGVYDTIDWDKDNPAAGSLRFYTSHHAAPEERMRINSDGDVRIFGNLIVEGEISGGGRAEEGGTIGGDGAEKVTATIEVGLMYKEISHTLGDNVIVQVYEWNANGQTWDMVLTDVETSTNRVTVRFGNATDVPHKVVII